MGAEAGVVHMNTARENGDGMVSDQKDIRCRCLRGFYRTLSEKRNEVGVVLKDKLGRDSLQVSLRSPALVP